MRIMAVDDELAVNHAVDRVRYFGDAASDLTLPDGWKFEVQGDDVRLYHHGCQHSYGYYRHVTLNFILA